jgi:hypothetical protein
MLGWIIQSSFISILFILLVHHLLVFLKTTLTVPKIKDLINSPNEKYQHIYDIISHNSSGNGNGNGNGNSNEYGYTNIDILPTNNLNTNDVTMKNELKSFLKKQFNTNYNE